MNGSDKGTAVIDPSFTVWRPEQGELCLPLDGTELRNAATLTLPVRSARQTGARIALELLDAKRSVVAGTTFALDWEGDNLIQLCPDTLDPRSGAPNRERLAAVTHLRLRQRSAGWWPVELGVGAPALSDRPPAWRVNESDTVIEAGWHRLASHPLHWSLASDPDRPAPLLYSPYGEHSFDTGPGLHHAGTAPWLKFGYPMQEQPGRLTVRRRFDLDVSDQREILAKLVWDRDTLLTVTATVDDGRTIFLCRDLEPDEIWRTIGAALDRARHLHHVDIDIREVPGRRVQSREVLVSLFWILLRRDSDLDRQPLNKVDARLVRAHDNHPDAVPTARRTVRRVPYHEPAESATPIGNPLRDGLPFGFLIGRDALPALRERVAGGPAAALFARIRAEADRALATDLVDRNYYGTPYGGGIGQPKGVMGGGMRLFAPTVALAHLLTDEARYAVAVRRWLLRAAHARDWRGDHGGCVSRPNIGDRLWYWDSFTGWYPQGFAGYMNHPFTVADVAFGVVVAYDMVYHALNDRERATIEEAFARCGVYMLADKLQQRRDYYVAMNQGILFALPLLMMTAFLRGRDPAYERLFAWTQQFLAEFARRPWNDEGVCGEGPGYGVGTLLELVEAQPIIAACTGAGIDETLPRSARSVIRYVQHVRSTWDSPVWAHRPHFLGLSDGSDYSWVSGEVCAFFAGALGDPVAGLFWQESFADSPPETLTCLLHLPDEPAAREPELPPAHVYRDQPMAFFRTGWRPGDTLLCLNALRQATGHGHKDRGSIIFEFGGEALVPDPGMIGYSDPASDQYHETFCHSTVTFDQRSQLGGTGSFPVRVVDFASSSGATCPGADGGIDWAIFDLTPVYGEARRVVRHLLFLRPDVCVLYDEVELASALPVERNFTLLGAPAVDGQAVVARTERNALHLLALGSEPQTAAASGWGTHWPEIPAHRVVVGTAAPTTRFRGLTVLAAAGLDQPQPDVSVIGDRNDLQAVSIARGERRDLVLFGDSPDIGTVDCGRSVLEIAGRAAVVRLRDGRPAGCAALAASRLTWNGHTLAAGAPGIQAATIE